MSSLRRFSTLCVGLILVVGCSERDPGPPSVDYDLPDANPVMPSAPPKYNPALLTDQANYKATPHDLSDKDKEDIRTALGIKAKPKTETEGEGESADAGEGKEGAGKGSVASKLQKGLKNLLG